MHGEESLLKTLEIAENYIKAANIDDALKVLNDLNKSDKDIVLLYFRKNNLDRAVRNGVIDFSSAGIEQNKIARDLLDIIEGIKKDYPILDSPNSPIKKNTMQDAVWENYFPARGIPFSKMLDELFFNTTKDVRYPIHGPRVVQFTKALFDLNNPVGLFKSDRAYNVYKARHSKIQKVLLEKEGTTQSQHEDSTIIGDLLTLSAIYHDIGKYIKLAKHPEIGGNLIRYYNADETKRLLEYLSTEYDKENEQEEKRQNRFAQLTSIIRHHDKFGVVSTGEASYPIFSDILYFNSDATRLRPIKKNVTAVMLLNLADIAAVSTAPTSTKETVELHIKKIYEYRNDDSFNPILSSLNEVSISKKAQAIMEEISNETTSLGLSERKITNVLNDWSFLLDEINTAKGDKIILREQLIKKAQNPSATIERIYRLIMEALEISDEKSPSGGIAALGLLSHSMVEMFLVSRLGTYKFQNFCEAFATVVKLDYGLRFFASIVCACTRKKIFPDSYFNQHKMAFEEAKHDKKSLHAPAKLTADESKLLESYPIEVKRAIVEKVTHLIIRVLEDLVSRYAGVFNVNNQPTRRFGMELGDLSQEKSVWESIISQLCLEEGKETFALSWMIDEVTIWSFD